MFEFPVKMEFYNSEKFQFNSQETFTYDLSLKKLVKLHTLFLITIAKWANILFCEMNN